MAKYDVARLDEMDGVVKKVRRALGVTAFGVNYFDLPPGAEGLEHNETQTNQEEVYVYVKGSGRLRFGTEEIEVGEGIVVRVDPEVTRQPVAGDDGTPVGGDRRAEGWPVQTPLLGVGSRHAHDRADRRRAAAPTRGAPFLPGRLRARRGRRAAGDQGADRETASHRRVLVRLVLWNLADSKTTIAELRRYLRDESVDAFEECPGCGSRPGSPTR